LSKIVILSDLWVPFPGGAEKYIWNVADQMRRRGHGVAVYHSYFKAEDSPGIKSVFHDIGVRSQSAARHIDGWSILAAEIKATDPDVIITHGFFGREFADELDALSKPLIRIVHNGPRGNCHLAIFNSNYTHKHSDPKPQDMVIVPPAFEDVSAYTLPLYQAMPPHMRPYIGFIKPIQHKGVEFVYSLASAMPERKFLILRGEWNLIEIIQRLPNVDFMESVQDMRDFYQNVRLMLVPSLYEDAGTVAQESAVNRIPCISSKAMGLGETNAAGVMLDLDVHAWVNQIKWMDQPDIYRHIADAQVEGLKVFHWNEKFDELSQRIEEMGAQK
jgi:glycosyltransferase involved in cell wall biosynthesis